MEKLLFFVFIDHLIIKKDPARTTRFGWFSWFVVLCFGGGLLKKYFGIMAIHWFLSSAC